MAKFQTAQCWILRILVFLLPLFFLPYFSDFYEFPKLVVLVAAVTVAFLVWSLAVLQGGRLRVSPFDLPVLLFAGAVLISALLVTPNKVSAFAFPGTTTLILAGSLLYFLVVQAYEEEEGKSGIGVLEAFTGGAAVAALLSFFAGVGLTQLLADKLPTWATGNVWTPLGGSLAAVALFAALLPLTAKRAFDKRILYSIYFILLLLGVGAQGFHSLPGKPTTPVVLPFSSGWGIALETAKKQPLLGVGPGNFLEAFNRFRPIEHNSTSFWNLRFTVGSNWYLDIFTVAGIVGLGALAFLALSVARLGRPGSFGESDKGVLYSLYFILILFALVPAGAVLVVAFYLLLATVGGAAGRSISVSTQSASSPANILPGLLLLVAGATTLIAFYFGLPTVRAEVAYKAALDAVAANDGQKAYDSMRDAIRLDIHAVHYRITNSQLNLALANSIANAASQKAASEASAEEAKQGQVSETDRNTISTLVQQAIGEAKAAISLHQNLSTSWANLAQIYRSIMGLAQGADQFAIGSYQQAIALEPTNPNLRIELGGIFYALKQYDEAVRAFELAVAAKPDLANAHYNLAIALRDAGKTTRAAAEMRQTLALIAPGARDWDTVRGQLEELEKKLAAEATPSAVPQQAGVEQPASPDASQGGPPLQAPQPAPSPVVEPPLDLPEGAAPPSN